MTNRERKLCHGKYYATKVAYLETTEPSQWWNEVVMIAGMAQATGGEDICSYLHLDGIAVRSNLDTANMINTALLEPIQVSSPLACLPPFSRNSEILTISLSEVFKVLLELNPRKAGGPDGINNCPFGNMLAFQLPRSAIFLTRHSPSISFLGRGRMLTFHH